MATLPVSWGNSDSVENSVDEIEECHHSADDALEAFRTLPERDKINLMRVAKFLAGRGNLASPDELISEAYIRISDGERRWPRHVAFPAFLKGVMKSLATDRMFLTDTRQVKRLRGGFSVVNAEEIPNIPENDSASRIAVKQLLEEAMADLENHFEGDDEMQMLLMGIDDGLRGKALREVIGVDATRLEALRTRLNRKIDKLAEQLKAKEGRS